ncbi:alpha/beta hydrolase family protein [Lignipirellula cremea]|uniref:Alpha/beta hydrolase family protein n=1 Tax=Lignipirellula cremea TaxID=2528010 RepID=A0A518DN85_9BACT|nr:hypothetical protein [Lignipirellula cremea]QDU93299.1 Alpha/beta hydrolase family protein [Lignipirellula cremea]
MRAMLPACLILALFCATPALAQDDSPPLILEKMGLMFVGGRPTAMPGGGRFGGGGKQTQIAGQAPVHYLIPPAKARAGKRPVVMIPGMGLTSYLYLGTPDGREAWAQTFAKAGYPVYVFDEPNNAISGFEVARFTSTETPPRIMLWANESIWRRWGIGPEPGVPAENTRFPVAQIDQLQASMTPIMGGFSRGGGRRGGGRPGGRSSGPADGAKAEAGTPVAENPKVSALLQLLEKIGPATLLAHSAAGSTAFEAARQRPDLVKAIVAIEVAGSPSAADDLQNFSQIQFLGVYGDNFDLRPMAGRLEASRNMAKAITAAGGRGEVISLPEIGVHGNSHLMMQDNNNQEIARMILQRLEN